MAAPIENQKIFMITGKGGVGKSAVAAALAQKEAKRGRKALLVELGEQSYFQYIYGQPIGYEPVEISPNFSVARWSGEECLREYVYHFIKVKKIVDLFFDNRIMRTFIQAAPALKELAILGKITSGVRHWGPPLNYDVIMVDGFATGHFLALLRAPIGMSELIESGPMGEQSRKIKEVLKSPDQCGYIIVTMPEELPVTETVELAESLKKLVGQEAKIICNRIYACPIELPELQNQFAMYLKNVMARQHEQLENLKKSIGNFTVLSLQLLSNGRDVIDQLERELP